MQTWAGGYGFVGLPWLVVTLGVDAPWYLTIGGQVDVPVAGPLGLFVKGSYVLRAVR